MVSLVRRDNRKDSHVKTLRSFLLSSSLASSRSRSCFLVSPPTWLLLPLARSLAPPAKTVLPSLLHWTLPGKIACFMDSLRPISPPPKKVCSGIRMDIRLRSAVRPNTSFHTGTRRLHRGRRTTSINSLPSTNRTSQPLNAWNSSSRAKLAPSC